jgi:hypothetical protein
VTVYRRLSPPVLIAWMERSSGEAASYFASLDPFAPARIGVSWAGEAVSPNWFDVARELTERWHHQQQIRLALAEPGGARPRPPHADFTRSRRRSSITRCSTASCARCRSTTARVPAAPGTAIRFHVSGECGGDWHLYRGDDWLLAGEAAGTVAATVTIPAGDRLAHLHEGDRA